MPATEAQIRANQRNAALSTGPRTEAGKEHSRANALKHGMTGTGIVLAEADALEVDRRAVAFASELNVSGEMGQALARRAALNSVRMERGADQQTAALSERVRQVEADFVPPEGVDEAEAARLRSEAARIAMFDPSREAILARRYEAAAERTFFRCLKELRQMERTARAETRVDTLPEAEARMGSFLQEAEPSLSEEEFEAIYAELGIPLPRGPVKSAHPASRNGRIDLPIAAARRR